MDLGGQSFPGKILIYSDRFAALAEYHDRDDSISVKVVPSGYVGGQHLPLPKTFFWIFLLVNSVLAWATLSAPVIMVALDIWSAPEARFYYQLSPILLCLGVFVATVITCWISGVTTWHGAEHKAIYAWENFATCDMEWIKRSPRITPYCGTRVAVLFLLMGLATGLAAIFFDLPPWAALALFALASLVMNLTLSWPLSAAPPIIWLSCLMQRYITTAEPSDKELRTAQAALKALVDAESPDN